MDLEKLQRDLKISYNKELATLDERVSNIAQHIAQEWGPEPNELSLHEIKTIATTIVDIETQTLHSEVESLLAQKEQIERMLERKALQLQNAKYDVFNAMEAQLREDDNEALAKLHQVKLQFIDLFDLLSEMVESAIVTTLEKSNDGDIKETLEEITKEFTFQAIKEGPLNTLRIRKILSTILQVAVDIAEAEPNKARQILTAVLKGMRSGLIKAIDRFKKHLAFMPVEAKHLLIRDYDTIVEDLNQTDVLFNGVVHTKAAECEPTIKQMLFDISKEMHYDLQELVHISKETAEIMRERFSELARSAVKRADTALHSQTAQEAKRMGIQAWGIAKNALGQAIKTAKDKMEKK